jgi:alpha-beta hydrolase superfamily lysophospholipase
VSVPDREHGAEPARAQPSSWQDWRRWVRDVDAAIRTVERQEHLEELAAAGADGPGIVAACLRLPLYATRFGAGFGTLYTAEYRPAEGAVSYHWPESTWNQSLDDLRPGTIQVRPGGH